ncbi:MAG: glycoside hydrolase family 127 protein [Clostridia bacterium]|nr:glycoside hydrolase family 127 protein [Clostridia bacterium]
MIADTSRSPFAKASSVPFQNLEWTGGLYKERFDTVAAVTVPHLQRMFEDKEISHVVENFRIAAGEAEGAFSGTVFGDGDFYKWFESAVYTAVRNGNQPLLDQLEEYIALFSRAQLPDGYLSTKQIIGEKQGLGLVRQGDINDFEVYNMGHMFTSACLYYRLTGKDSFLNVAEKAAGYLKTLYEEAARTGEVKTAVCPSHYMGLIELYRTTGKKEYLDLARLSVQLRDSVQNGLDDNQDRLPLKQHRKIVGHAVRANYLYAGVTDLYLEEGDEDYRMVLESVWKHLVTQKMYITGGCGALYNGASPYGNFFHHQLVHQAYGYEYQLPNVTAYNETCASLGGVFWAWRMFLMDPKAEYMDMLERMMLNVNLAGVSMDGKKFFYENMLRRAKELSYELIWGQTRSEYILSYCCPPNLARTIAQTSEYAYAVDRDGVWTGLYGENRAHFCLENGAEFTLEQKTEYPWNGRIEFSLSESNEKPFSLRLRIPAWAIGAQIKINSETISVQPGTYHEILVKQPVGFSCTLEMHMQPRLTVGHGLIEEDCNQACVEVGPMVYCVEGMDAPEVASLEDLLLPLHPQFTRTQIDIEGRCIPAWETTLLCLQRDEAERNALYRTLGEEKLVPVPVRLIPYYAWDNRAFGEMMIWLPLAWRDL